MKIIVLGTRGFPNVQGGVEVHCENLYPHLVKLGCEVTVFTRKPYVDPRVTEYKGVKLVTLYARRNKFLEAILHTSWGVIQARLRNPDIVHIHAIGPSVIIPLARLLGLRVVVTNHGPDYARTKWGGPAKMFLKFSERVGAKTANHVISITHYIADDLYTKTHVDSTVIPNGTTLFLKPAGDTLVQKYGLEKNKYILAVGRLVPEKAIHDLIEAFGKSGLYEKGWKLVIAGKADHEDRYSRDLKVQASSTPGVVMTGFIHSENINELHHWRGLFVIPSYYEGLPIALLEALSHGKSVIASNIPANRELNLPKSRYFGPGDIPELSKKLKRLAEDPNLPEDEGFDLEKMLKKYSWDLISDKTFEVYKKVLGLTV